MSLTIDYITMPPKSQEVSQIQHGDQVRYEQSQQEVASQVQQQVRRIPIRPSVVQRRRIKNTTCAMMRDGDVRTVQGDAVRDSQGKHRRRKTRIRKSVEAFLI